MFTILYFKRAKLLFFPIENPAGENNIFNYHSIIYIKLSEAMRRFAQKNRTKSNQNRPE
jgi:hypothetical protein